MCVIIFPIIGHYLNKSSGYLKGGYSSGVSDQFEGLINLVSATTKYTGNIRESERFH